MFRVGLVLLKQMLGSVDKLRELQGMYETMERLRSISPDFIREEVLVQEVGLFLMNEFTSLFSLMMSSLIMVSLALDHTSQFLLSDTSHESLCAVAAAVWSSLPLSVFTRSSHSR